MFCRIAALSVLALSALAGCGGGDAADGNKTKATAESSKPADSAPPPPATAPSGSAAGEAASKGPAPDASGSAHAEGGKDAPKDTPKDKAQEGGGEKAEKVIHLPHAKLEFNHPGAGWTEVKKGGWTMFRPADKTSVLGFVEFDKPGEATSRVAQIADNLDLTQIKWKGDPKKLKVGTDKLEAQFAEGSCKVATNKHDCEIEYYTVEGSALIVYAFETDVKKTDKHEKVATKTVESLRKADGEGGAKAHGGHGKKK